MYKIIAYVSLAILSGKQLNKGKSRGISLAILSVSLAILSGKAATNAAVNP